MPFSKWIVSEEEQEKYTRLLQEELAPLRVRAGISQGELASMIGVSRQTYSSIETGKKKISWSTYLTLIWFFDSNFATREYLRNHPAYPAKVIEQMNLGVDAKTRLSGQGADELLQILGDLDSQAIHTLKTMLLVEYARCRNISDETVIKAFDGIDLRAKASDAAAELALRNIKNRRL